MHTSSRVLLPLLQTLCPAHVTDREGEGPAADAHHTTHTAPAGACYFSLDGKTLFYKGSAV